ncbi:hypothetical protein ASPCAL06083 [Aspergillus calidoustus]|uniref:Azaphilone pigments biosynthesis cluster protein L N-terminal domain-containing protein n=1 Tax=Aspergillus calidoustus TaxID=454130 RepID=A0A0U5FZG9_ASPCI|nr:hypothetical protein ASPCAL06083 [Aspergillus calidoustus]
MDPVSISVSVLAVITAALQSANTLKETVTRFKERNKTLGRLQNELEDLTKILDLLQNAVETDASVLALLEGPVGRCSQLCSEFEDSIKVFANKSKTGFRDWTRMEFMRGDINEFIETLAGYKSTISVGLGTITMHTSKVSYKVIEEYNEMIKDTSYSLKEHLMRIDEKLAQLTIENTEYSDGSTDLEDERTVTEQCLRICEDARSYIESLTKRQTILHQDSPRNLPEEEVGQRQFEAQNLTRQALNENQQRFVEIIVHLQKRLEGLIMNGDSGDRSERLRLQQDLDISKQCLEVCQVASDISNQKIFKVGEVVADGESDQVVVTTLADLFDVRKALSTGNSAQLVGSMTPGDLQHLVEKRYSSRFGALNSGSGHTAAGAPNPQSVYEARRTANAFPPRISSEEQSPGPSTKPSTPSPNEVRKRMMGGAKD